MANPATAVSRVSLGISSDTQAFSWPNYGSALHQVVNGRPEGYGDAVGRAVIGRGERFYGNDLEINKSIIVATADWMYGRYCRDFAPNWSSAINEHILEQDVKPTSTGVGLSVDIFGNGRHSHYHEGGGCGYVHVDVTYVENGVQKHINFGLVHRVMVPWNTFTHYAFNHTLGGHGISFVKLRVVVGMGIGEWHDSGHNVPNYWSPDVPIANPRHPIGVGTNYWCSLDNSIRTSPVHHAALFTFYPPSEYWTGPERIWSPGKTEGVRTFFRRWGSYGSPCWSEIPPYTP